jgi:sigma-E factor negative regulatory protein RseA
MTANDEELLSALVDGELQGEALDRAIALLSTDQTARERFQRYQLASNVLHGQAIGHQQGGITQQISAAIADEPVHSVTPVQSKAVPVTPTETPTADVLTFPERFWKQTVGLAVAASFGALAVVGTMTQPDYAVMPAASMAAVEAVPVPNVVVAQQQTASTSDVVLVQQQVAPVPVVTVAVQESGNRWTVTEQAIEDRLNVYLVDHNEYAGASDIFSNARVIAYESGR